MKRNLHDPGPPRWRIKTTTGEQVTIRAKRITTAGTVLVDIDGKLYQSLGPGLAEPIEEMETNR
jgi:hypothetical protein